MPAPSRPRRRTTIIVGSLDNIFSSSSSEDEEEEEEEAEEEEVEDTVKNEDEEKGKRRNGSVSEKGVGKKAPAIIISLKKVCKVCKEEGHQAGFQGATTSTAPESLAFSVKCPVRVELMEFPVEMG